MAMTLRLTETEQAALRERAEAEGISMQEAARRAVHGGQVSAVSTDVRLVTADATGVLTGGGGAVAQVFGQHGEGAD